MDVWEGTDGGVYRCAVCRRWALFNVVVKSMRARWRTKREKRESEEVQR